MLNTPKHRSSYPQIDSYVVSELIISVCAGLGVPFRRHAVFLLGLLVADDC